MLRSGARIHASGRISPKRPVDAKGRNSKPRFGHTTALRTCARRRVGPIKTIGYVWGHFHANAAGICWQACRAAFRSRNVLAERDNPGAPTRLLSEIFIHVGPIEQAFAKINYWMRIAQKRTPKALGDISVISSPPIRLATSCWNLRL
jgi:hypothetical protein